MKRVGTRMRESPAQLHGSGQVVSTVAERVVAHSATGKQGLGLAYGQHGQGRSHLI